MHISRKLTHLPWDKKWKPIRQFLANSSPFCTHICFRRRQNFEMPHLSDHAGLANLADLTCITLLKKKTHICCCVSHADCVLSTRLLLPVPKKAISVIAILCLLASSEKFSCAQPLCLQHKVKAPFCHAQFAGKQWGHYDTTPNQSSSKPNRLESKSTLDFSASTRDSSSSTGSRTNRIEFN